MTIVLILGLASLATSVRLLARALGTPRAKSAERLANIGAYGFAAQHRETEPVIAAPRESAIGDLVTRVGELASKRVGALREADMRNELMAAGMYQTSPRTLLGYRVFGALLMPLLFGLLFQSIGGPAPVVVLGAAAGVFSGWLVPLVIVRRAARLRLERIDRELPDLIDILVVTVEAGLGFAGAMRVAAGELQGPLRDELLLTLQEQTMGLSAGDALANFEKRCDTQSTRSFVRAVVQGESLGVSTGQIMRSLADEMRKKRRSAAEEQAQRAPVKMLFPLVFLIFPVLFIVLLAPAVFSLGDTLH